MNFVQRELVGAGSGEAAHHQRKVADAVCLQETDPNLVRALRDRAAQADPPLFYVHACGAFEELKAEDASTPGGGAQGKKCSSITCIVASKPFHEILPDIVVVVGGENGRGKTYTRRFAAPC